MKIIRYLALGDQPEWGSLRADAESGAHVSLAPRSSTVWKR
jgi:hypothetical protein